MPSTNNLLRTANRTKRAVPDQSRYLSCLPGTLVPFFSPLVGQRKQYRVFYLQFNICWLLSVTMNGAANGLRRKPFVPASNVMDPQFDVKNKLELILCVKTVWDGA